MEQSLSKKPLALLLMLLQWPWKRWWKMIRNTHKVQEHSYSPSTIITEMYKSNVASCLVIYCCYKYGNKSHTLVNSVLTCINCPGMKSICSDSVCVLSLMVDTVSVSFSNQLFVLIASPLATVNLTRHPPNCLWIDDNNGNQCRQWSEITLWKGQFFPVKQEHGEGSERTVSPRIDRAFSLYAKQTQQLYN